MAMIGPYLLINFLSMHVPDGTKCTWVSRGINNKDDYWNKSKVLLHAEGSH
jgi:hypothetical protein